MALSEGQIVAIIYGCCQVIFLFIIGLIVYHKENHEKVVSKSFAKSVWEHRKIYGPVLVHIYDTTSDLLVLILWYNLMNNEIDGYIDYNGVNIKVYFWASISSIILYRVIMFCYAIILVTCPVWFATLLRGWNENQQDGTWYHPIFALLDLYIFVAVYESMKTIKSNKDENVIKKEIELATTSTDGHKPQQIEENDAKNKEKQIEFEMVEKQKDTQFWEAALESIPQAVLQTVFIIRSNNDKNLATNSNQWILILSAVGSVINIANKFTLYDDDSLKDKYRGFKLKEGCPQCINYWYFIPTLWRYCTIITRFVVIALIWSVCGGHSVIIFAAFSCFVMFIAWIVFNVYDASWSQRIGVGILMMFGYLPGIYSAATILKDFKYLFLLRIIENVIGYTVIAIFGFIDFQCSICNQFDQRRFGDGGNELIPILSYLGVLTLILEAILFAILLRFKMFKQK